MKRFLITFLIFLVVKSLAAQNDETLYSAKNQLDINNASYQEIARLPVSEEIALALYERVLYRGYFKSIYELHQIEGIDQELFNKIKQLIRIEPYKTLTSSQEKIDEIYYRLDRWSSSESMNNAFIDLWIEKALEPMNVNSVRYDELVNLQNVSPIDAAAIVNHRKTVHWIRDQRDLRDVPGFSYYAYRTARYFLDYKDVESDAALHGNILMRVDNTPFMASEGEQTQEANITTITSALSSGINSLPSTYFKTRLTFRQQYKFGLAFVRKLSEPTHYSDLGGFQIPNAKFYIGMENQSLGPINLRKLYLGNFSVTLGQGVIMENTDFFIPRKSGYGFRKRFRGISGDISRTRQYTLRGGAAELEYNNLSLIGFVSFDSRDAILNRGSYSDANTRSFNQLIVLNQRFEYAVDDTLRGPEYDGLSWINSVNELTYGGHLQYDFLPGTHLGVSYYESAYDRPIDSNPYQITALDYKGDSHWDIRRVTTDSEIIQSYGGEISRGINPFWAGAQSFRRVYGFDFQTVIKNIVIQGEWGELDKGGSVFNLGDDPKAMVLSAYAQFPSFNILLLYRNYDVAFDNPYQRSFSNYRRFKGTIYEDYYYLQSVLYGQLYETNPQPQAEEGLYLSAFYQMSRSLTMRFQYDNWTRKADAAKMYRLVGTINYRPVFPLAIQLRNKWQAREEDNSLSTKRYYKNYEFRGRLRLRLSNYDSFDLMYSVSKLLNHPRPRVFGDIVLDGEAITANYVHNFNKYLKLSGMLAYYKGFLWNFEDTQFMVMESDRGAIRYFLSLYARLNLNLSVRLKYTGEYHNPVSGAYFYPNNQTRQENPGRMYETDWIRKFSNLFYVEFNYNF